MKKGIKKGLIGLGIAGIVATGFTGSASASTGTMYDGSPEFTGHDEYFDVDWEFIKTQDNAGNLADYVYFEDSNGNREYVSVEYGYDLHPYYPTENGTTLHGAVQYGEKMVNDWSESEGFRAIDTADWIDDQTGSHTSIKGYDNEVNHVVNHWTANEGATAQNNADYGKGSDYAAHFYIDDEEIIQIGEENHVMWHASSSYYNSNSMGIEMAVEDGGGLHPQTYYYAVSLNQYLMREHGLSANQDDLIRHYDSNQKNCPAWWVDGTWDTVQNTGVVTGDHDRYYKFVDRLAGTNVE